MRILLKFPTRERPLKALTVLRDYISMAADNDNIVYLISIDRDDRTMNNADMFTRLEAMHENVICISDISKNKVHAYNRDIELIDEWDIIVDASDDMHCVQRGWDDIIRETMETCYPDTDGILHFNDGFVGPRLITLPIVGRKYYDRFKYIYHPSYTSLWCDNEQMEVAKTLKKIVYSPRVLFKHMHFSNVKGIKRDALIQRTESFFYKDKKNFQRRQKQNFNL